MGKTFFFTYIGVLLAFSVTLTVLVSSMLPAFAASGKKPLWYGLFSSLFASCAAYLSTLFSNHMFSVFWFLAAIYLLFGIIHVAFFQKKYFHSNNDGQFKLIAGEIMFGLSIIFFSIIIFSSLQYFVAKNNTNYLFYPVLMSTIAFFIPFLFVQTFEAAYNIPAAQFKTWQYPLHEQIEVPDDKPGEKLLVIGFEISKKSINLKRTYFRAKAPEGMMLGELYYHFINDYNDTQSETTIEYSTAGFEPHDWWFRRKPKWYQAQKILDPGISVRENGIKENSVIICERIKI